MTTALINRQITLAAHPNSMPVATDFILITSIVTEPVQGQVLLRTLVVSIDP